MDATIPFAELFERSKDDYAIIVGSEVREVIGAYRRCLSKLGDLEDQLKSALSSPQQGEISSLEFFVMSEGHRWSRRETMEDALESARSAAAVNVAELSIMKLETRKTTIPYVTPPVTAEGKDRG